MNVTNMSSSRGNSVPNQFIIKTDEATFFQSYETIIVKIDRQGNTYLDKTYWDYSRTTRKYRNQFLGETKKETQNKIDSGKYKLINLN